MPISSAVKTRGRAVNPAGNGGFDVRREIPVLAYEEHPAFEGLRADEPAALRAAVADLEPLEEAVRRLADGSLLDLILRKNRVERRARTKEALLRDAEERLTRFEAHLIAGRPDWSPFEVETIRKFVMHMRREVQNEVAVAWRRFHYFAVERFPADEGTPGLAEMRRDGCKPFELPPEDVARMRQLLADDEAELRAIDTRARPVSAIKLLDVEHAGKAEFKALLSATLERAGVLRLAGQYLKAPVRVQYVSHYLNRPEDWWWKTRYADAGVTLPRTANMHYDSYCGMVKCMLYLSEVRAGSGPFCYVPGTHRARVGFLQRVSGKAIPYADLNLQTAEQRRFFLRLPSALRNISHFGDDLLPGSELEQSYLRAERQFVGPACNLVLFDNYGLHRGGLCETGERLALQINLVPIP